MTKITAKLRAFGKVRDGEVVRLARKRVLIRWVTPAGHAREVWATPIQNETDLHTEAGIGKCVLSQPLPKKKADPVLIKDPDALALPERRAQSYPPGSIREMRQRLLDEALTLMDEANQKMNEAEDLLSAAVNEATGEQGRRSAGQFTYRKKNQ